MIAWALAAPWIAVLLLITFRYHTRRPHLRDYDPAPAGPLLSVIIPARNEAVNVERCVRSILTAAYTPLDVIVVDDRSTDGTGDIVARLAEAADARGSLRLVRGADLPPGWFGKQWEMVTFWERLIQPQVFLALQARVGDLRRVNRTRTEWDAMWDWRRPTSGRARTSSSSTGPST